MALPPSKTRGRPKVPWEPFADILFARLQADLAADTVEEVAKWLAKWGEDEDLRLEDGNPLKHERIRERIKKRYGGAAGYKQTRADFLLALSRLKPPGS